MDECPGADAIFSGHEMAMKVVAGTEVAIHEAHMTVNHVAGAVGVRKVRRADLPAALHLTQDAIMFQSHLSFTHTRKKSIS